MSKFTISIHGTKRGPIWWPVGAECEKDFSYTVKADETLRDALLKITNDGDFQYTEVLENTFIRVKMLLQSGYATLTRERIFDITSPLFTSIQDMVINDYPVYEEN